LSAYLQVENMSLDTLFEHSKIEVNSLTVRQPKGQKFLIPIYVILLFDNKKYTFSHFFEESQERKTLKCER